ncbi:MAG TPA: DNA repair protein RecN, partial [Rhizobiales bacterium]|nr:DNA repair protein RecN [Hyphomicrobiales bacterium]
MLTALSIRDIVLIEKLDLAMENGLSVLTGETGAGKSILLDSLGLALGVRGDAGLVRVGADKGSVTAAFYVPEHGEINRLLEDAGIDAGDELIVRRVQNKSGASRALVNDQPVSISFLKSLGSALCEIHGQHEARALIDVAGHRRFLDAFGGLEEEVRKVGLLWSELASVH